MGTTPNYTWPYPELTDPPDGATQIKSLALGVDTSLKTLADSVDASNRTIACIVYATVAQPLTNNAWTSLTFNQEHLDTDNMHSTASQTSRITIPVDGLYLLTGLITFAQNGTGRRGCNWLVTGGVSPTFGLSTVGPTLAAGTPGQPAPSLPVRFTAGQIIELQGYQDTGAALNTLVAGGSQPFAAVVRLGP